MKVDSKTVLVEALFYSGTVVLAIVACIYPATFSAFLSQNFPFWILSEFIVIHSVGLLQPVDKEDTVSSRLILLSVYLLFVGIVALLAQEPLLGLFVMSSLILRFWRTPLREKKSQGLDSIVRSMIFVGSIFAVLFFGLQVLTLVAPELAMESNPLYGVMQFILWIVLYYSLVALVSWIAFVRSLAVR